MTLSLPDEIRANTQRIIDEFLSKGERYRGADWCGVRPADVTAAAEIMQNQAERLASCTCQPAAGFEIDHKRADARPYAIMEQEAVERMKGGACCE